MPQLRALFFDFDGLILDTESACFAGWQALFRKHGHEYALADYLKIVGSHTSVHDPRTILDTLCGRPLDWTKLDGDRRKIEDARAEHLPVMPGVRALIETAAAHGLKLAVVSSSSHQWVRGHLTRHGLVDRFDTFVCRGDAPHLKPAPDLYLEAMRRLGVAGDEAIAFEDSHNGSLAAKRAGLWCVAVPNAITTSQNFSHVDMRVDTLDGFELAACARGFGLAL